MKPPQPAVIGRYQIRDRIGHGGMGVLYLAIDPLIDRLVAVKLLRVDNDELRERFMREARAAGRLQHPNIVTIFDVGEHEGQPFIAMEYIAGETIAELIQRRTPLSLPRRLELIECLCTGLSYAHKTGIVHRDIKPANLMVNRDGLLKILDFGIARVVDSGMTRAGDVIGTPNYMSPEQIAGARIDHRSDIFAVGAVLYELLAYRRAFPGDSPHAVMHQVMHGRPAPLPGAESLDPALVDLVNRALNKSPADRFQDLGTMGAELARIRRRIADGEEALPATVEPTQLAERGLSPPHAPHDRAEFVRRRAARIDDYLGEADDAFRAGKYALAQRKAEQAALLDPDEPRVHDALERIRLALTRQAVEARSLQAADKLQQGDLPGVERLIEDIARLDPEAPQLGDLRARVREWEEAAERRRGIARALDHARDSLRQGALESAIRAATEVLALDPTHDEGHAIRERARAALDERERRQAMDRRVRAAVEAARFRFFAGEHRLALEDLAQLDRSHPDVAATLAELEREFHRIEQEREEARRREQEAEEARQRIAAQQAAAARAAEQAAAKRAALERAAAERAAAERAAAEHAAAEQAAAERAAAERAAAERAAAERAAAEQAAAEHAAEERPAAGHDVAAAARQEEHTGGTRAAEPRRTGRPAPSVPNDLPPVAIDSPATVPTASPVPATVVRDHIPTDIVADPWPPSLPQAAETVRHERSVRTPETGSAPGATWPSTAEAPAESRYPPIPSRRLALPATAVTVLLVLGGGVWLWQRGSDEVVPAASTSIPAEPPAGQSDIPAQPPVQSEPTDPPPAGSSELDRRVSDAITAAERDFAQGRRSAALASLERFRPEHPAISNALQSLRGQVAALAAAAIAESRKDTAAGRYTEAIARLEAFTPRDPAVDRALTDVRNEQARGVIAAAREHADAGRTAEAVATLRAFGSTHPAVNQALDDIMTVDLGRRTAAVARLLAEGSLEAAATQVRAAAALHGDSARVRQLRDDVVDAGRQRASQARQAALRVAGAQDRQAFKDATARYDAAQKAASDAVEATREFQASARLFDLAARESTQNNELAAQIASEMAEARRLAAAEQFDAALDILDRVRKRAPQTAGLDALAADIQRRRVVPPPPRPDGRTADAEAIDRLLTQCEAAWATMNPSRVAVCGPTLAALASDRGRDPSLLNSTTLRITNRRIVAQTADSATVEGEVLLQDDWRRGVNRPASPRQGVFTLAKRNQTWVIESYRAR